VFYHLKDVQAHDDVMVTVAGGATVTYRVVERRTYAKADGLPAEVFGDAAGSPRLVLITCGGRYDFTQASYDDNVVVIAVPA
jgi:sortase (surface protein transpeptidase)